MEAEASFNDEDVVIPPPAQRDAKGRLLPGQRSINPYGRPVAIRDLKEAAKSHTRQALNTLISVMNDTSAPSASRVTAATALLDRGWGKPQQSVEARVSVGDVGVTAAEVLMRLTTQAREAKIAAAQIIDVTPQTTTKG